MDTLPERRFRLALTIEHNPEIEGLHAFIVLAEQEGKDTPVLVIQAGGVESSPEGAVTLADMLRDASEAIDEYLTADGYQRERPQTNTAELPTVRPKFNPRPAGFQK